MSRHLPIQGNPSFSPGLECKTFSIWQQRGLIRFSTLSDIETARLLNYSTITEKFSLPQSHAFHYEQCVSFIPDLCREVCKRFQETLTGSLLQNNSYTISDIYKPFLLKTTPTIASSSVANWGRDFPDTEIVDKILQGCNKIHRLIPNKSWRETTKNPTPCLYTIYFRQEYPRHGQMPHVSPAKTRSYPPLPVMPLYFHFLGSSHLLTLLKIPKDPLLINFFSGTGMTNCYHGPPTLTLSTKTGL